MQDRDREHFDFLAFKCHNPHMQHTSHTSLPLKCSSLDMMPKLIGSLFGVFYQYVTPFTTNNPYLHWILSLSSSVPIILKTNQPIKSGIYFVKKTKTI